MKPSEAVEASEYVEDIIKSLEGIHPEAEDTSLSFEDTVPGRKQHVLEGSRRILELYGKAIERPVRDIHGNIRFEYAMGTIYSDLGSYNGSWDFEDEEVEALHNAYRYLFLKSDLSEEEVGYTPAEYSDVRSIEKHEEALFTLLEGFWENREYLASSLEEA
jgi:hypothetical protein